ncbi:hypothetical protein L195_g023744 [Trifolium pratense]|uniref:Uncharacterized protein n=1 Tax=Trifolium pratense TaxID=57577 RepID=A0A2K3NBQ5_TRIPR|nr:hypothetical protein L195_g023744 [Trifolium pratense]
MILNVEDEDNNGSMLIVTHWWNISQPLEINSPMGMNDMLAEESIVLFVFSLFPALACACILKLSQCNYNLTCCFHYSWHNCGHQNLIPVISPLDLEFGLKCGKPCAACDHYVAEEGLGIACCENGQLQVHNGRLQELQNQGFSCLIATPTGPYSCNWVAPAIPKSLLKEVLLQKSYSAVLS